MTIQIKPSEWEALSAFLDNQLSERDRARFESRLKNEPDLRQALEDLRRTRISRAAAPRPLLPREAATEPRSIAV
jgi:anti-sigma factor RsiW